MNIMDHKDHKLVYELESSEQCGLDIEEHDDSSITLHIHKTYDYEVTGSRVWCQTCDPDALHPMDEPIDNVFVEWHV